ncbi:MAG: hypothetical protein ABH811_01585 [archaeon]
MANKKSKDKDKYKLTIKETYVISKNDKKLLELVKVAKEIVFKEDEILFKELAKH